jgi:hypothetical protein
MNAGIIVVNRLQRMSGDGNSYTPSAEIQAWVNRILFYGFTPPDEDVIRALDEEFVSKSIADGSWALTDELSVFAFNNASLVGAATVKLKYRVNELIIPTNETYGVGGFSGNATSSYIDFTFNPATQGLNYTQNSAHRSIWNYTSGNLVLDGVIGSNGNSMLNQSNSAQRINQGVTNLNDVIDLSGTGYKSINRSSANDVQGYRELVRTDRTAASSAMASENQCIGRRAATFHNSTFAFYDMGGSLSETLQNNRRNYFRAYLTRIGLS